MGERQEVAGLLGYYASWHLAEKEWAVMSKDPFPGKWHVFVLALLYILSVWMSEGNIPKDNNF